MLDSIFPQVPGGCKSMRMESLSKQEWPGLTSQKFNGNRRHIRPVDQMNGYEGGPLPLLGRKHFVPTYSSVGEQKPQLRMFPDLSNKSVVSISGRNYSPTQESTTAKLQYIPPQRRVRPEKLNWIANTFLNQSSEDYPSQSVRTFRVANRTSFHSSNNELNISVEQAPRNYNNQKEYISQTQQTPGYSNEFYNPSNIPGTTNIHERQNRPRGLSEYSLGSSRHAGKLTWKEREKLEARVEDQRAVNELDIWEERTLKVANPKRRDPDKYFENSEATISNEQLKANGANKITPLPSTTTITTQKKLNN